MLGFAPCRERRKIWLVDAHSDRQRFIVRVDEMLTVFPGLECVIRARGNCA
jgi:hypothetical protein